MSRLRDLDNTLSDEELHQAGGFMGPDGELHTQPKKSARRARESVKDIRDDLVVSAEFPHVKVERSSNKSGLPWLEAEVPENYTLDKTGVCFVPPKKGKGKADAPERLSGPAWVTALTRDNNAQAWGRIVGWIDADGSKHQRAVPACRLHESGNQLAQELASEGLEIIPGKERQLTEYLGLYQPKARQKCIEHLGWLDTTDGRLVYVLPTKVITSVKETQSEYGDISNGK